MLIREDNIEMDFKEMYQDEFLLFLLQESIE